MDIPGIPGALETPEMWERAQQESERLLNELKEAVQVETRDIGVLRKELRITVPGRIIADHLEHNYRDLMHDAFVPGFRRGRAPRRLIEKRYGSEVRESLTTAIVGQSYYAAEEKEKLETLGDPLFRIETGGGAQLMEFSEALQHIKLPAEGDLTYVCEVEVKPTFELPELKGIEIRAPQVEITEDMIAEELLRRRKLRGRVEVVDGPAEKDDLIVADVVLTVDGREVKREENVTIGVRPTRVDGIPLPRLDEALRGTTAGQSCTVECTVPDDYEQADLRGKSGRFEFRVHEVKRLVPMPLDEYLKVMGFGSEDELRADIRADFELERDRLAEQAKRAQVENYLLENTQLDLPPSFSRRQTDRALARRIIELQLSGVPAAEIESQVDALRARAGAQVANELKLSFILEKVAQQLAVEVTDEQVNTAIAAIARRYNRRFDRVRDELQSRGLLDSLVENIRHQKCIDRLLADARIAASTGNQTEST